MCLICSQPNGPATPVDMTLDYFIYDYEFGEPPRVTSLQNTVPTPTNADFGEDANFVADQRGFESIIHYVGASYLSTDGNGQISDARVLLNKVHACMGNTYICEKYICKNKKKQTNKSM